MIEKLLPSIKTTQCIYKDGLHTFEVAMQQGSKLLTKANFPNHGPLAFLDEQVQIHEPVLVFIKDEKTLRREGWVDYLKTSLKHPNHPFKIGKDKRALLGTTQKGKIGITRNFMPYFWSSDEGWRFSPNEIKLIIKLDTLPKSKSVSYNNFLYDSQTETLSMPNLSKRLVASQIMDLKRVMKMAGLI